MYIETGLKEKLKRAAALTIPGVGSGTLRRLLAVYGSLEEAWKATPSAQGAGKGIAAFFDGRHTIDLSKIENDLKRYDISLTAPGEADYPFLLGNLPDAPPVLFYRGTIDGKARAIAVVGARRATAYGKSAARFLSAEMARRGYVVISGLARGIDGAAHEGALDAGVTWAFLAGSLEKIYPPEHKALAEKVLEKGALISEFPPGQPSKASHFPARNRLISGSALGVVVVEAAERSGSMITVDFALEQGREVFAVPGPIFSEVSKGCHRLLQLGARLVETADDIIEEIGSLSAVLPKEKGEIGECSEHRRQDRLNSAAEGKRKKDKRPEARPSSPEDRERKTELEPAPQISEVLSRLSDVPLHLDRLADQCALSPQALAMELLELELNGKIRRLPGQYYVVERDPVVGRKLQR